MDVLEPRQQVKAKHAAEGEGHFALPMVIDVLLFYGHCGGMTEHAFNHGRGFGRRAALELRVDAGGFAIDVPINHDATATITGVPFSHKVLIPGAKLL